MSPSRRDVLKSLAIATGAVAIPVKVEAAPLVRTVKRGQVEYPIEPIDDVLSDHMGSFERLSNRIYAEQWEIQDRLVKFAQESGVWLEEETPGTFVARRHGVIGHCDIVTRRTCTCQRFEVFHRCEHNALVRQTLDEREVEE